MSTNKIIEHHPTNMEAYFHLWEFLYKIGNVHKLDEVSKIMIKAIEDTSIPTAEWMKDFTYAE
jgi:hypothetical protein